MQFASLDVRPCWKICKRTEKNGERKNERFLYLSMDGNVFLLFEDKNSKYDKKKCKEKLPLLIFLYNSTLTRADTVNSSLTPTVCGKFRPSGFKT